MPHVLPPLALALVAALAATPTPPAAPEASAPVRTLTITARDYAFDAPDTVMAGRTLVRLANRGPELHHAFLIRLEGGRTMADLVAALKAGGPPPAWAHDVGGPNTPAPGGASAAVVTLTPGNYALLCMIPSADGTPHVMKGMSRPLTVVAARTAIPTAGDRAATVRDPDVTMRLTDYAFTVSKPLTAGSHVVRVSNGAKQPHEVFIAKLAPGRTVKDLAVWIEKMQGPPPGMPIGGTASMASGESNDVLLDLTPGEYGLYCFVPDAKDGKPHVAHGMLRQITVR
jgi:uncharacterized cupredoxin-like copper-binding protein